MSASPVIYRRIKTINVNKEYKIPKLTRKIDLFKKETASLNEKRTASKNNKTIEKDKFATFSLSKKQNSISNSISKKKNNDKIILNSKLGFINEKDNNKKYKTYNRKISFTNNKKRNNYHNIYYKNKTITKNGFLGGSVKKYFDSNNNDNTGKVTLRTLMKMCNLDTEPNKLNNKLSKFNIKSTANKIIEVQNINKQIKKSKKNKKKLNFNVSNKDTLKNPNDSSVPFSKSHKNKAVKDIKQYIKNINININVFPPTYSRINNCNSRKPLYCNTNLLDERAKNRKINISIKKTLKKTIEKSVGNPKSMKILNNPLMTINQNSKETLNKLYNFPQKDKHTKLNLLTGNEEFSLRTQSHDIQNKYNINFDKLALFRYGMPIYAEDSQSDNSLFCNNDESYNSQEKKIDISNLNQQFLENDSESNLFSESFSSGIFNNLLTMTEDGKVKYKANNYLNFDSEEPSIIKKKKKHNKGTNGNKNINDYDISLYNEEFYATDEGKERLSYNKSNFHTLNEKKIKFNDKLYINSEENRSNSLTEIEDFLSGNENDNELNGRNKVLINHFNTNNKVFNSNSSFTKLIDNITNNANKNKRNINDNKEAKLEMTVSKINEGSAVPIQEILGHINK